MKHAFSGHFMGIVSGVVLIAVGCVVVTQVFFAFTVGDVFASYAWEKSLPVLPVQVSPPPIQEPPAVLASDGGGGLENQATAVVENPYDMMPVEPSGMWLGRVLMLVIVIGSGAAAARIGPRVTAWRGAVSGLLAGVGAVALFGAFGVSDAALICLVPGSLAYAGGGLARLFSSRTLPHIAIRPTGAFADHWRGMAAGTALLVIGAILYAVMFPAEFWPDLHVSPSQLIENPYGMGVADYDGGPAPDQVLFAMILAVFAGAVAARIGPRVAAWRGVVPALIATAAFVASWTRSTPVDVVAACVLAGLLAYAGGGIAKGIAWARTRAA